VQNQVISVEYPATCYGDRDFLRTVGKLDIVESVDANTPSCFSKWATETFIR